MVAMQQWIADTIYDLTGTGFGTRFAGLSTLPGGSAGAGETGVKFSQFLGRTHSSCQPFHVFGSCQEFGQLSAFCEPSKFRA